MGYPRHILVYVGPASQLQFSYVRYSNKGPSPRPFSDGHPVYKQGSVIIEYLKTIYLVQQSIVHHTFKNFNIKLENFVTTRALARN